MSHYIVIVEKNFPRAEIIITETFWNKEKIRPFSTHGNLTTAPEISLQVQCNMTQLIYVLPVTFPGWLFFAVEAELMFWGRRADILSLLCSDCSSAPQSAGPCVTCRNQGPADWFLGGNLAARPGIQASLSWCGRQHDVLGWSTQQASPFEQTSDPELACRPLAGLDKVVVKRQVS